LTNVLARLARSACLATALGISAHPAGAATLSGAYLAATQADFRDDYDEAVRYYMQALLLDPGNSALMESAVVMEVARGDVEAASTLAEQLAAAMPENQVAGLVLLADALAAEDFARASSLLQQYGPDMNPLLAGLVAGWVAVGQQDFREAQQQFDALDANDALTAFGQYHKALALAFAGDFVGAEDILAGEDGGPLHLDRSALMAHAQILAQIGREAEAIDVLDSVLSNGFPDAALERLRDRLAAGEEVAFTQIRSARDGAAQAFLTLATALGTGESERLSLIHAQLAAHVSPRLEEATLLSADILEAEEQYALAQKMLDQIPENSPWFVTAGIRRANVARESGDVDEGIAILTALSERRPDQIEVLSSLGDALRNEERYEEAVAAYDKAIALIDAPQQPHWVIYYSRGIARERAGQWPAARSDFEMALKLEPSQPHVLNYLGYSMVENGGDLDQARAMIEQAVQGEPDDGYITDSLGWVLYRMGRIEEAVPHMLRAVELTPDDPIINDHLGDVLWKAGREREAEFQWRRALSFGPAEDLDMDRVREKLRIGLDAVLKQEGEVSGG
jgi:Flp pilus assembly protein TadD